MIKHLIIIVALGIMMPAAHTQVVTNYKRVAEQFYAKGDYYSAAQYYEKFLGGKIPPNSGYSAYVVQKQGTGVASHREGRSLNSELLFRMGECYFHLNDYIHAQQWYKLLMDKDSTSFPQVPYLYAVCLRAGGKFVEASKELEAFIQQHGVADQLGKRAQKELEDCIFVQQQMATSTAVVKVEKLNANINKEGANYAASWLNNSTLVFTSTRSDFNNTFYNASYQTGSGFGKVERMNVSFPRSTQWGTPTFTPDGNRMYYTGWTVAKGGKKLSGIYMSQRIDDRWSQPVLIDGKMEDENGYSSRQPQVTADGKYLLFASDRPDGIGGFDIWYAELDANGRPGQVMNMGPGINTLEDEEAPFYHAPSNTLVFASKGRTGMGGFDLFASNGDFTGSWSPATNLGFPVNSEKDDSYFISRGKNLLQDAMISSDRNSLCCYELYSVQRSYTQVYSGVVMDCETKAPLNGATVLVKDARGNQVAQLKTDEQGKYSIMADAGLALQIGGSLDGYQNGLLTSPASRVDTVYAPALCLAKKPDPFKGKTKTIGNEVSYQIVFELKTEIAPASYPYLDLIAAYLKDNPDVVLEIDVHTDGIGSVKSNQFLSQGRANACAEYLMKAGISPDQIMPKGLGECCPLEKETNPDGSDNPAAREKNRRVVFKIIKFN